MKITKNNKIDVIEKISEDMTMTFNHVKREIRLRTMEKIVRDTSEQIKRNHIEKINKREK